MPTIVIDGTGVPKSALVDGAYEYCGLNPWEYERTPEEISTGMRGLNAVMAVLAAKGVDLRFDFPTYGNGLPEAPSGIPDLAVEPVCALLAQRIAPALGATLSEDAKAVLATAMSFLVSNYAVSPPSRVPADRPMSSGMRHQRFLSIRP